VYLENVVVDAVDPQRLGRFWEAALGGETLTDAPDGFETRVPIDGGPTLDYCFQPVPAAPAEPVRLHLDLAGGERQAEVVQRLLGLGATHLDIGQHAGDSVPWIVLADPEGNPFCVMEQRPSYVDTGPIAGLPLDSADPERDLAFWSWLTGWVPVENRGSATRHHRTLRHPSLRGPLLQLCSEPEPKVESAKNRMHLDIRLEAGDDPDDVARSITERDGSEIHPDWGDLPWRLFADPSGNEFCVLPARG